MSGLVVMTNHQRFPSMQRIIVPGMRMRVVSMCWLLAGSMYSALAFSHGPGMESIKKLTVRIAEEGASAELYLRRGEIYQRNQHWGDALRDYNKAVALAPESAAALYLARLYVDLKKFPQALDAVNRHLVKQPEHGEALYLRAHVQRQLNNAQAALADYRRAILLSNAKTPPEWHLDHAATLVALKQQDEAVSALDAAMKLLGPVAVLQLKAVEIELNLARYDAALARIDSLMEQAPRKDHWLARRGDILKAAGRDAEARAVYQEALEALGTLTPAMQQTPVSVALAQSLRERLEAKAASLNNSQ
jgi:tetratricopeptide (TPR) repeat protein